MDKMEHRETFCKNALVQTRSEPLNEEQRFLQAVKSDTEYSDGLLIGSWASPWKLRGTRVTAPEQGLRQCG